MFGEKVKKQQEYKQETDDNNVPGCPGSKQRNFFFHDEAIGIDKSIVFE